MGPVSLAVALVWAGAGCGGGVDRSDASVEAAARAPEPVCRPGGGWSPGQQAFVDRTDDWGLAGLNGNGFGVADLDGDGLPDLVVMAGSPYERRSGHVFLNRAAGGARRFEERTEASRLFQVRGSDETGRHASMIRFGDVDGDGDVDAFTGVFMYLTEAGRTPLPDQSEILLNDGSGVFTLGPSPIELIPFQPLVTDGFFFDQDLDGRLDLAVGLWWEQPPFTALYGQPSQLFRGDGAGGFTDVTEAVGMLLPRSEDAVRSGTQRRPLMGLVMCDVNDDGRMDMVGAAYGRMYNELFLADGDRFVEIGATTGIGADDRLDYSDDESFRCYCLENRTAPGCDGLPRPVYPCPVRGWIPGRSDQPWSLGGNTFSYACADLDNDGDLDLYESNIRHPDVGTASDPSEVLVNEGSSGSDIRFVRPGRDEMGLTPPIDLARTDEGGQHNAAFDFDNDGRLDLLLDGSPYPGNRGWLFHQRAEGTLRFEWIGADAGFDHACANGTALADFDHDGDLDMVVGTYGCNVGPSADYRPESQPVRFYENVSNENNWIAIRLIGRGPGGANRQGIGARVRVTAAGTTQTRLVHAASQGVTLPAEAWFGLGPSCDVDSIEVRWPDPAQTVQTWTGVQANHRIELREGEPDVRYLP